MKRENVGHVVFFMAVFMSPFFATLAWTMFGALAGYSFTALLLGVAGIWGAWAGALLLYRLIQPWIQFMRVSRLKEPLNRRRPNLSSS